MHKNPRLQTAKPTTYPKNNKVDISIGIKQEDSGEVVVAQLVMRSHPIPEVRGLNTVIGKIYNEHLLTYLLSTVLKRQK